MARVWRRRRRRTQNDEAPVDIHEPHPALPEDALRQVDELRQAANAAAQQVQRVYTTFLVVASYVAVTVWSTTHEQLLRESTVTLPLLNVGLPVVQFYIVAPALELVMQFMLFVQLYLLADKVGAFEERLSKLGLAPSLREHYRRLLAPFPFVYTITFSDRRYRFRRRVMRSIVWLTMYAVPLALVVWVQVRFLPYHSQPITSWHRCLVFAELALLWVAWSRILSPSLNWSRWFRHRAPHLAITVPIAIFSMYLAVVPGREMEGYQVNFEAGTSLQCLLKLWNAPVCTDQGDWDWCLQSSGGSRVWLARRCMDFLFDRSLQLSGHTLVREAPPTELLAAYYSKGQSEDIAWRERAKGLSLAGRDLRFANLRVARVLNADLDSAQLQGANLRGAQLQGADLALAHLQGTNLEWAQLQGTNLFRAQLQGADLGHAQLQGTMLIETQLQGATLFGAHLQGANLRGAQLQGADLGVTQLQGANLGGAQLQGANLERAQLQGANFGLEVTSHRKFPPTDLSLIDLRYSDFNHPIDFDIDKISSNINDPEVRRAFVARLMTPIEPLSQQPVANHEGAIYQVGAFPAWGKPPSEEGYERRLVPYLVQLACTDRDVAVGIARSRGEDWLNLAPALLKEHCDAVAQLPEELRRTLVKERVSVKHVDRIEPPPSQQFHRAQKHPSQDHPDPPGRAGIIVR